MGEMITMLARARAKASTRERLLAELRQIMAVVPTEPGYVSYQLYESADDPLELMIHETWQSPAHLQQHQGAPHMQALFGLLPELLDGPPSMTTWKAPF